MVLARFFRHRVFVLSAIAILSLVGMGMNSLVVESATARPLEGSDPATPLNAPYLRNVHVSQEITIDLLYRGYGNTVLRMMPRYCFSKGFTLNGTQHGFPNNQEKWCQELRVDLGKDLQPGHNTLVIEADPSDASWSNYSPIVGLTIGSPLLGAHTVQSMFTLLFMGSIMTLVWLLFKHQGYDLPTRLILMGAYALFLQCLNKAHHFDYSLDFEKHSAYIQFVSNHFFNPYVYTGAENWHPPLYYWLCAIIAKTLAAFGTFDVWTGVRLMSLLSYSIFLYFGMRTITRVLPAPASYIALSLLAFWPSGLFSSSWIYNDVLIYPAYAAAFYYTLVWYEDGESDAILKALIACGLALMVKTSGLVPLTILAACVACKLITRGCTVQSLLNKNVLIGGLVLAEGVLFNFGREICYWILSKSNGYVGHLSGHGAYKPTLENFLPLHVGDLIPHPFFLSWEEQALWNLQMRTMLFTNMVWGHAQLAPYLQLLCLIMLAYIFIFMITRPASQYLKLFPLLAGIVLPIASTIGFTFLVRMGACMDFRYIQPALVAITIVFLRAVQETKAKNWPALYYGGNAVAVLFVILSVLFFESQFA